MNLIEKLARMLDTEGAYAEWYDNTSRAGVPHSFTTRQKYFQASYENKAVKILTFILQWNQTDIRKELIEFEINGWKHLGMPVDMPAFRKMVEEKYKEK